MDKYVDDLKTKYTFLVYGTAEYWEARAKALERCIDQTVVIPERENYKMLWMLLKNKESK